MDNVHDIASKRAPLDLTVPLQLIKRMHQLNKLSNNAFGVAALVISKMQSNGNYTCTLSRQDLVHVQIMLDEQPFATVCNPEIRELAHALYHMQAYCGLWNHTKFTRVGKTQSRHHHFTERQLLEESDSALYSLIEHSTPIHFAWYPDHQSSVLGEAKAMIDHQMRSAKWADITNVKLT